MDRDGPDVVLAQALAERGQLCRGLGASSPGRRVVGEDLQRVGADLVRTVDRLDHAGRRGAGAHRSAGLRGAFGASYDGAAPDRAGPRSLSVPRARARSSGARLASVARAGDPVV